MRTLAKILEALTLRPLNLRVNLFRRLILRTGVLSYEKRLEYDLVPRPNYGFCIFRAAKLAVALGYPKISIIEFGVAGGNGLLNAEYHAKQIQKVLDIDFEIYGFDSGTGLPPPVDYRDVPYIWGEGFYKMDVPRLEEALDLSKLVIGDLRETSVTFFDRFKPAPIGCVLVDLDYYSSTMEALSLFDGDADNYLPRVHCYFDDLLNEFVGAYRAIKDFNEGHSDKKFAQIHGLSQGKVPHPWGQNIFLFHDFSHSRYNDKEHHTDDQIPLNINRTIGHGV